MIFYSTEIENNIIDYSPLENLIDELNNFREKTKEVLRSNIREDYIENACIGTTIAFYCMDTIFDINNCPSAIIYKTVCNTTYILYMCTHPRFRGQGYAKRLLDDLRVHGKIILSAMKSAISFYESYGFKRIGNNIQDFPILLEYEEYEEKEYFIMEYTHSIS